MSEAMVVCEDFLHKDEQVQLYQPTSNVCGPIHFSKPALSLESQAFDMLVIWAVK